MIIILKKRIYDNYTIASKIMEAKRLDFEDVEIFTKKQNGFEILLK
jgi:hypothetical protein